VDPIGHRLDLLHGLAERDAWSEIEREGYRRKDALVTDR
jgi:hypothetical protein